MSSCAHVPLAEAFAISSEQFTPTVGFPGSPMNCMAAPQTIPVNPDSVLLKYCMFSFWMSPLESREVTAETILFL